MGIERGATQQSNRDGKGQGAERGGQVSSSLSILFARVSLLHSHYTSFVCLLMILLTDRGLWPWADSAEEKKQR